MGKTKRWTAGMVLVLALVLVAAGCAKPAAAPTAQPAPGAGPTVTVTAPAKTTTVTATAAAPTAFKPVEWNFTLDQPDIHVISIATKKALPVIEAATGGRIKFKLFTGGSLAPRAESLTYINKGLAFGGAITPSTYGKSIPIEATTKLPFFNGTWKGVCDFDEAGFTDMMTEAIQKAGFPNVRFMGEVYGGAQDIAGKSPIHVPSDIKGKKFRASGTWAYYLEAWGATAVVMDVGEVYDALARGIIDGTTGETTNWTQYKQIEVAPYLCKIGYFFGYTGFGYNEDMVNKLPADLAATVRLGMQYLKQSIREESIRQEDWDWRYKVARMAKEIYYPTTQESKLWLDMCTDRVVTEYKKALKDDALADKLIALIKKTNLKE